MPQKMRPCLAYGDDEPSNKKSPALPGFINRLQLDSVAPGERNLFETAAAKALRGSRDRLAAERTVELHRGLVVGQRPDHQALQSALRQIAPRRGEQPAAETQALILRAQIQLVDLAVIEQAARAVAAVVGVARDVVAERENGN